VSDGFRSSFRILAIEFDALLLSETLLCGGEPFRFLKQTHLAMLRRHDFAKEREVIAKGEDRFGLRHFCISTQALREQRRCHWRDVLVREANVDNCEESVTRFH